jgi:hypothetical protein
MFIEDDLITQDDILNFCLDNNICYIKTDYFYRGNFIWRNKNHPEFINDICVVGHSDYPITDNIAKHFKKIFCSNRDTTLSNVYGIPLGLTNDCDDSPIHKIYGNKKILIDVINEDFNKENLLYLNFNVNTHHSRKKIFNEFEKKEFVKIGNIENSIEGRKLFLKDIKKSKFVLCPRGNGIDTHRIWETLYMGSIPIVQYENTHHLFLDLPILFINDWNELNKNFLEFKYEEINSKKWNMDKLKISYWTNFIKNNI